MTTPVVSRQSSAAPPHTVLIADDHPIFRAALRKLLETDPGLRVVGEAGDGRDAVRMVSALRPDVLLLDLVMPVKGGLDTLQELSTMDSPTRTLLLTAEAADSDVVEALQFGARGIVLKQSASEMLFKSIRAVMAGQYWVGRECMADLIDQMRRRTARPSAEPARPTFGLTPRELEIITTVAAGCTNSEMAEKLSISVKTVKHHLTNIFAKLGVENRLELALFAVRHRLATPLH